MIDDVGTRRITAFSGTRLGAARQARGWSRGRLAVQLDVSVSTVAAWERGDNAPEPPSIAALASALDIDAADLLDTAPDTWTLVELRAVIGLRQIDAARELQIQTDRLGRLELGYERVDPRTRAAMARLYGVDEPAVDACWQRGRDRLTADS